MLKEDEDGHQRECDEHASVHMEKEPEDWQYDGGSDAAHTDKSRQERHDDKAREGGESDHPLGSKHRSKPCRDAFATLELDERRKRVSDNRAHASQKRVSLIAGEHRGAKRGKSPLERIQNEHDNARGGANGSVNIGCTRVAATGVKDVDTMRSRDEHAKGDRPYQIRCRIDPPILHKDAL